MTGKTALRQVDAQRRHWLQRAGTAGLALAFADWPVAIGAPSANPPVGPTAPPGFPPRDVFDESDAARVRQQLGVIAARPHAGLELRVTPTAEIALQVPVLLHSSIPGTTALALLVEKNPTPLVAWFEVGPGLRPQLQLHIKMAQTTDVELYAWADDQV